MNEGELEQCYTALGVGPGVTLEELERTFMKRNFALIKGKSGSADEANPELDAQRRQLRAAYDRLAEHLRAQQAQAEAANPRRKPQLGQFQPPPPPPPGGRLVAPPVLAPREPVDDTFILFRFDSWGLNVVVPPLMLAFVWVMGLTFFGPMMRQGPSVCVHEFGHATGAWLSGWAATPLPFGWTPVEQVHSNRVYFGLLFLLAVLVAAGVKERKAWPIIAGLALAGLQYYMTWRLSEHWKEFWMVWGGVGGEFILSTLLMMTFWVRLPDKFKWGAVRYLFFLIGAAAFLTIWQRWQEIYPGREEIPFGSMINGEDDQGGDMNRLMADYGWKKFDIRRNYWLLGRWCWVALAVTWLVYVLRLDKAGEWVGRRFMKAQGLAEEEEPSVGGES